jgi:hypothetical protein
MTAEQTRVGPHCREITRIIIMLDFLMVAGGVAFFGVAILYVLACEKM